MSAETGTFFIIFVHFPHRKPSVMTLALSPLNALSPLDGRYANKLDALRPIASEWGYMHRRVQVEVTWFIALSQAGFQEFPPYLKGLDNIYCLWWKIFQKMMPPLLNPKKKSPITT